MKKSNPSVSTHSPAQRAHAPTHPHTSFPPKHSPGPAKPISRQHFSLSSPIPEHPASPAGPAPDPIPPSASPRCRRTHFLAHPSRGNRMCVSVPKHAQTAAPATPVRLHRATCVLVGRAVCFRGQVSAVPGTAGRSRQLALAIDTDLPKLVLCQVSCSLLERLPVCPLSPFHGVFLCLSEPKKKKKRKLFCEVGGCLACGVEWQHRWRRGGIMG